MVVQGTVVERILAAGEEGTVPAAGEEGTVPGEEGTVPEEVGISLVPHRGMGEERSSSGCDTGCLSLLLYGCW